MNSKVTGLAVGNDGDETVVVAYSESGVPITKVRGGYVQLADLWDMQQRFPQITRFSAGRHGVLNLDSVPDWPALSPRWPVKGSLDSINILLDPGHSRSSPGAKGRGDNPPLEYDMNLLQAKILAEELRREGAHVSIVDPDPDNLSAVALEAYGKNLYLALHHDAFDADGVDEGTSVHIHPKAGIPTEALAKDICAAISGALRSRNRGVYRSNFKVLKVSERQTDCPLNLLVESYFIDDYSDIEVARKRSTDAARAIASAVVTFFEKYPQLPSGEWLATKTFESGKDLQLSNNFFLSELVCRCGCEFAKVNGKLVKMLQRLRDQVGGPVNVNSGYRCVSHNAAIGGVQNSEHTKGTAADIVVPGMSSSEVQKRAKELFDGVGSYVSFTHVDVRGYTARW